MILIKITTAIGIVVMTLLTLTLTVLLPVRSRLEGSLHLTRLLLAGCTTSLLGFFITAFVTTFDASELEERNYAVMMCMIFFIPAQYFFNLAVLNQLRRGALTITDLVLGPICYVVSLFAIGAVYYVTGTTFLEADQQIVSYVEYGGAGLFLVSIIHYNVQEVLAIRSHDMPAAFNVDALYHSRQWFFLCLMVLMVSALFTPFIMFIFVPWVHAVYWLFEMSSLSLVVISIYGLCLIRYGMTLGNPSATPVATTVSSPVLSPEQQRVAHAVRQWIERKRFREKNITLQATADEMGVSRILLTEWLRTTEDTYFSRWVTTLRVEEAKRLMVTHPDWDNKKVAGLCGFSSRSYFQRCFHDVVGMTPSAWAEEQ